MYTLAHLSKPTYIASQAEPLCCGAGCMRFQILQTRLMDGDRSSIMTPRILSPAARSGPATQSAFGAKGSPAGSSECRTPDARANDATAAGVTPQSARSLEREFSLSIGPSHPLRASCVRSSPGNSPRLDDDGPSDLPRREPPDLSDVAETSQATPAASARLRAPRGASAGFSVTHSQHRPLSSTRRSVTWGEEPWPSQPGPPALPAASPQRQQPHSALLRASWSGGIRRRPAAEQNEIQPASPEDAPHPDSR